MNIEHVNHRGPTRSCTTLAAVVAATVSVALLAGCTSARSATPTAVSSGAGAPAGVSTLAGAATTATATPTTSAAQTTAAAQTTTSPPITTTTTTIAPPTTTTIPLVTEGAVVLVANASNVPGGAAKLASALAAVGFHMASATNAGGNEERLDVTKVYFLAGGEAVAQSLAKVIGGVAVTRMPVPAPITGANADLADATVLIMLGTDLAGKKIPGLRGR